MFSTGLETSGLENMLPAIKSPCWSPLAYLSGVYSTSSLFVGDLLLMPANMLAGLHLVFGSNGFLRGPVELLIDAKDTSP